MNSGLVDIQEQRRAKTEGQPGQITERPDQGQGPAGGAGVGSYVVALWSKRVIVSYLLS